MSFSVEIGNEIQTPSLNPCPAGGAGTFHLYRGSVYRKATEIDTQPRMCMPSKRREGRLLSNQDETMLRRIGCVWLLNRCCVQSHAFCKLDELIQLGGSALHIQEDQSWGCLFKSEHGENRFFANCHKDHVSLAAFNIDLLQGSAS